MISASTEHTKKRGLSSATPESIHGNSATYFSQKKSSVSTDDLPMNDILDTNEGRRQRRFDSLSRILSLHSRNSACTAVTILNTEIIIAANCADGKEPATIAQLLQQRLTVLREVLRKNPSDIFLLEDPAQAEAFFEQDLDKLKRYGGFFQPRHVLAQALYKLNKSISVQHDPSTHDEAFSSEEIFVLLNSDNFTVLVAGEEQRTEENGLQQDWDLGEMTTALSPSYTNSSFTTRSSLMSASDHSSSMDVVEKNSGGAGGFTGLWEKADKPCPKSKLKSKFFSSSGFESESESDDGDANTDSADVATQAKAQHQEDNEEDFFLNSLNESFASKLETSSISSLKSVYDIRYGMNIYQNGSATQIAFPESIYHTPNKPSDVSGFHAEQLIAFYLKDVKKINLHDITAPPIPFGISKLCCAACTILYQFERIKIRGTSFNNILGVPRIITVADTNSPSATGTGSSLATESIFSSPQKASTLPRSPQSFKSPDPITRVPKSSPWS